nr:bacteriorhodopsin C term fragment [Halobacterium salinarum]
AESMRPEVASTFKVLRNWSAYPVVWLIGSEGAGIVPLNIETALFMVLDVSAKVGFGLILLRSRAIFGEAEAPEPSAGDGAAATS